MSLGEVIRKAGFVIILLGAMSSGIHQCVNKSESKSPTSKEIGRATGMFTGSEKLRTSYHQGKEMNNILTTSWGFPPFYGWEILMDNETPGQLGSCSDGKVDSITTTKRVPFFNETNGLERDVDYLTHEREFLDADRRLREAKDKYAWFFK